jgi:Zn finger protein HypA/HybF involved in hydrogenase expression
MVSMDSIKNYCTGAIIGGAFVLIRMWIEPENSCAKCHTKLPKLWIFELFRHKHHGCDSCPKCHSKITKNGTQ